MHSTADGQLVVHHDDYLGRVEQATGHIESYTREQLQALDVGSWFDPRFKGLSMPTLDDVLALAGSGVHFEVELCTATLPFLHAVIGAIERKNLIEQVELTSWHLPLLFRVEQINRRLRMGVFFEPLPQWMQLDEKNERIRNWLLLSGAEVAHLPLSLVNQDLASQLHGKGLRVHAADLNSEEEIATVVKMNVDQFSTDDLDLALYCLGRSA